MLLSFLSALVKLRKANISFSMSLRYSVCPSVRPHGTSRLPLDGFSWKFVFENFYNNLLRKFKFH